MLTFCVLETDVQCPNLHLRWHGYGNCQQTSIQHYYLTLLPNATWYMLLLLITSKQKVQRKMLEKVFESVLNLIWLWQPFSWCPDLLTPMCCKHLLPSQHFCKYLSCRVNVSGIFSEENEENYYTLTFQLDFLAGVKYFVVFGFNFVSLSTS